MFQFFKIYPQEHIWRFCVDGHRQISVLHFDQEEPLYLSRLIASFYFATFYTEPLSTRFLKLIHFHGLKDVCNTEITQKHELLGKFSYNEQITYTLHMHHNLSAQGFEELLQYTASTSPAKRLYQIHQLNADKIDVIRAKNQFYGNMETLNRVKELDSYIEFIIAQYLHNISSIQSTQSEEEKTDLILTTLIQFISSLERAHPFGDGNCRTICIALLNSELLKLSKYFKLNFVPVIMKNPNQFDGYSQSELKEEVRKGMARTQAIINSYHSQSELPRFDYYTGLPIACALDPKNMFDGLTQNFLGLSLLPESYLKRELLMHNLRNLHQFSSQHPIYKSKVNTTISRILTHQKVA